MKRRSHSGRGTTGGAGIRLCLLVLVLAFLTPGRGRAQVETESCAGDHAAFLYTLSQFVHWPAPPGQPLVVGILADDSLLTAFRDIVHGRSIDGRPVILRRLVSAGDVRSCQLVYIGRADAGLVREALEAADDAHVLTVSDLPGFSEMGGIVRLISGGAEWRFVINYPAAERGGLWISSDLLNLAVADVGGRR